VHVSIYGHGRGEGSYPVGLLCGDDATRPPAAHESCPLRSVQNRGAASATSHSGPQLDEHMSKTMRRAP